MEDRPRPGTVQERYWIYELNLEEPPMTAWGEAQYKAVYEADYWKTKIAPRVPECLDREKMVITRMVPTPHSTVQ